jgi:hypothetical protein
MDNIIKELKLQLGEIEVVLTIDDAKKLKNALDELFGKEVVREVYYHDQPPFWQWWYPTWSISTSSGPYRITNSACTAQFDTNTMTLKVS